MRDGSVRVNREKLYELVWARPLRHLAGELGVAVTSLVEACKLLQVPRPAAGHWTRLAHGQRPSRPPLAALPEGTCSDVELARPDPGPAASDVPVVPPRTSLRGALPAVQALRDALLSRLPDQLGMRVLRGDSGGATVRVTDVTRDRALLMLEALGRALAARGHTMRFEAPTQAYGRFRLEVAVEDQVVPLAVTEPMQQRARARTPAQLEADRLYGGPFGRRFDQVPSGQLVLRLNLPYGSAQRKAWADRENQRVEDVLGRVVLAIESCGVSLRERAKADEARVRAFEEERAAWERAERVEQHRKALGDDLLDMATRWSKAESIRRFLTAVEDAAPVTARSAEFSAWLVWARAFCGALDPLGTPGSIPKQLQPPTTAESAVTSVRDRGAR